MAPPPGGFPFSTFDPVPLGVDENGEHVHAQPGRTQRAVGGQPAQASRAG